MDRSSDRLELVRQYLAALERMATGDELAAYFDPEVVQEEFPNRLVPAGARRDLAALLDGAARGKALMAAQRYELRDAIFQGDRAALEVAWTGTLAIPVGTLAAGDQMHARFAVFLEFRGDRIIAQRNYDCFDPW